MTPQLSLINETDPGFNDAWDEVVSRGAPWQFLPLWRTYQRHYYGPSLQKDLSFVILYNRKPVAVAPLFMELDGTLSYCKGYQSGFLPMPYISELNRRVRADVEALFVQHVTHLAHCYKTPKLALLCDPADRPHQHNILKEFGFLDCSTESAFVDLTQTEETIRSQIRKSYRSLISKAERTYQICIFDSRTPSLDAHEQYRQLHHKAAGRVTRDLETFSLQYQMLLNDQATLIGIRPASKNTFIGFTYFYHNGSHAYYGSASDDPDYLPPAPIEHVIIRTAITYYKQRGLRALELGYQFNHGLFSNASDKEQSIAFFKAGFGSPLTLYRGIQYFDPALAADELTTELKRFIPS